ncbi:MAG: porin [Pseudomonadales bacterium]
MESASSDEDTRRQNWEDIKKEEIRQAQAETLTNEDPDAARRVERQVDRALNREEKESAAAQATMGTPKDTKTPKEETREKEVELYASVRLHFIENFDADSNSMDVNFGDGASRIGASGIWQIARDRSLFGRLEMGFNVLDSFTAKSQPEGSGKMETRLAYAGVESESLSVTIGKSYSAYYAVAGDSDRFTIFGGDASGVYNAGTDGGATGTGRADEALKAELYLDPNGLLTIKPFNVTVQYQSSQPIPHAAGQDYGYSLSTSTWLENDSGVGVGLAVHRSTIDNPESAALKAAGIDGDATAVALALRTYGDKWLASLVLNKQKNIETTNEQLYINATGAELFTQWQVLDKVWLIGGGNWLFPEKDDPDAGDYVLKYGVLGVRYTLDSFRRMIYIEWRDDHGRLANGQQKKSEVTIGIRWDLG